MSTRTPHEPNRRNRITFTRVLLPLALGAAGVVFIACSTTDVTSPADGLDGVNADGNDSGVVERDASTWVDGRPVIDGLGDPCVVDYSLTLPPKPCKKGLECKRDGKSDNGTCVAFCTADVQCGRTGVCISGNCRLKCSADEKCPTALFACISNSYCVPDCRKASQACVDPNGCQADGHCINGLPYRGDGGATTTDAAVPGACTTKTTTPNSGVTGTSLMGSLSDADKTTFCNWAAGRNGGYGCKANCDGGVSVSFAGSVTACKAQFAKPGCTATVSQAEGCLIAMGTAACPLTAATSAVCAPMLVTACR